MARAQRIPLADEDLDIPHSVAATIENDGGEVVKAADIGPVAGSSGTPCRRLKKNFPGMAS